MTVKSRLVINDSLTLQLLEELGDIGADLGGIGDGKLGLQFFYDLGECALAVATLQDLPASALQFDCALGEQNHAFFDAGFGVGSPAASGCESWLAGVGGRGHANVGPSAAGCREKSRFLDFALRLIKPIAMLRSE